MGISLITAATYTNNKSNLKDKALKEENKPAVIGEGHTLEQTSIENENDELILEQHVKMLELKIAEMRM